MKNFEEKSLKNSRKIPRNVCKLGPGISYIHIPPPFNENIA